MSNTYGLQFSAVAEPGNDYSERGTSRYLVVISKGKNTIRTHYSVGSAVALHAWLQDPTAKIPQGAGYTRAAVEKACRYSVGRLCVDDDAIRRAVRRAYLPTLADVLPSLLLDASTMEDCTDFWEWCEAFGITPNRKTQRAFEDCQTNTKILRRMLGADWDSAMKEAQEA